MSRLNPSPLLCLSLRADAAVSIVAGLAAIASARLLADITTASVAAVLAVATFALIYGLALAWLSARRRLAAASARAIVIGNFGWVAASVAVAVWLNPGPFGWCVLLGQAAAVLALAELQWLGLRRSEVIGARGMAAAPGVP